MMDRRTFVYGLSTGILAAPLAVEAQQPERLRRIGVLMGYAETDPDAQTNVAAFREGLQKLGWAEGRNIRIDIRWPIPRRRGVDATIRESVSPKRTEISVPCASE